MEKGKLEIGQYFQQGDCIFRVCEKPSNVKKMKGNIVVEGSHGGNNHVIIGGKFTLLQADNKPYLLVTQATTAQHKEHKTIELPAACYKIIRVMEYDHMTEESKAVID